MFGAPLEYTVGLRRRFVTFYSSMCVVGAGLTYLALVGMLMGLPWSRYLGCKSGGVFGLLLAYGMLFPKQRVMLLLPPVENWKRARW